MPDPQLTALRSDQWPADFARLSEGALPGLLGITVIEIQPGRAVLGLRLRPELLLPTGFVHAATVVALADTSTGYGCRASLPEHAGGFTTMELKANLLAPAVEADELQSEALLSHAGRTTQVWDATVTRTRDQRVIALFRCTQMLLQARPDARVPGRRGVDQPPMGRASGASPLR